MTELRQLRLDKKTVDSTCFSNLPPLLQVPPEFIAPAGQHHFKLLAWFSYQFNNSQFVSITTGNQLSAFALASNSSNTIHTFDTVDRVDPNLKTCANIHFNVTNFWLHDLETLNEDIKTKLLTASLIFLDLNDATPGSTEFKLYSFLKQNSSKALIICNKIWSTKDMRDKFWYQIPSWSKYDLSEFGSSTGTGLVRFVPDSIQIPTSPQTSNTLTVSNGVVTTSTQKSWTFVTSFFDLTKMSDISGKMKSTWRERLLSASTTMSIDANLVVFCDSNDLEFLKSMRPAHLQDKTIYKTCKLEDTPMWKHKKRVVLNRMLKPYQFDNDNTPTYYIYTMSKYDMLKGIMTQNPFSSSHFGWIDLAIERLGYKNCSQLQPALSAFRDKFSMCFIDYIPESLVVNLPEYYKWGRCSVSSDFFTGSKVFMERVCNLIEQTFVEILERGYGHTDEQLYSFCYFKNRHLFSFYYGDYGSSVTNYLGIEQDSNLIQTHMCLKSFEAKDWWTNYDVCMKLWDFCGKQGSLAVLGGFQEAFLKCLMVSSTRMDDMTMMVRAMSELKCHEILNSK